MFDHHDGVRPARHRTAGRDWRGRSRQYRPRRRDAAGDHLVVQHHADRRSLAGGSEIGRTHRKAIDIGAIERRHVDRRHDVLGKRAAERVGERALLRRHRTRKQGGFETRQRILARQDGQELVLIDVAIFRRGRVGHFRTHISPATYRHRPGQPAANPSEPPDTTSQASARAIASSDNSPTASVAHISCFRSSNTISAMPTLRCNLARQRQIDRLARAAAREAIEHGKRQRPPCRKGLIRRARQHDDGRLAEAPDGRGAAGLQGNAMGKNLAARSQCGYRRVGAADAGAADDQEQIARAIIECRRNRSGIAARGGEGDGFGAGRLRALRDQFRRHAAARHIDDAQPRTADVQSLQSGGARQQEIARQHAPPGLRDETARGDIAAGPAHALPRNRLRQHLRHRPGQIDGIGIEHAVASRRGWPRRPRPRPAAPTTATANRRMRRRDRARKKRSHPPRQCRAADRQEAAASRRRCNAALP